VTGLRMVALDLSLRATGLAATHDATGEPRLSCRTVVTQKSASSPTLTDHRRLHKVFEAVVGAVRCRPDLVVVEWQPQLEHGDTSLRIAELHGLVKHWLYGQKIPYVDVRPQELKTYATGNANADKDRVREAVIARYGKHLHVGTHDEADATALLMSALDAYGQALVPAPADCRKALARTSWPELGGA
jgi:crossover junction endodeoxyribonuclease RuvC